MIDNTVKIVCIAAGTTSITDIVTSISAAVAVLIAAFGLYTWKIQLKGTAKYDIARKLLKSVYNVKYAVEALRSRHMTIPKEAATPVADFRIAHNLANEKVYQSRLNYLNQLMIDFEDRQLDAEIILKNTINDAGDNFRKFIREIEADIRLYLEMHSFPDIENDQFFRELRGKSLIGVEPSKDEVRNNIDKLIRAYHDELDKYL
jgi:hypothetical protein